MTMFSGSSRKKGSEKRQKHISELSSLVEAGTNGVTMDIGGHHCGTLFNPLTMGYVQVLECISNGSGKPSGRHDHQVREILYMVQGELTITMKGEVVTYGQGELIDIPLGEKHDAICTDDFMCIAILHPPEVVYPEGKKDG